MGVHGKFQHLLAHLVPKPSTIRERGNRIVLGDRTAYTHDVASESEPLISAGSGLPDRNSDSITAVLEDDRSPRLIPRAAPTRALSPEDVYAEPFGDCDMSYLQHYVESLEVDLLPQRRAAAVCLECLTVHCVRY